MGRSKCRDVRSERSMPTVFEKVLPQRDLDRAVATDKLPENFRSLGFIRLLFAHSVLVHGSRSVLATCWFLYRANSRPTTLALAAPMVREQHALDVMYRFHHPSGIGVVSDQDDVAEIQAADHDQGQTDVLTVSL